MLMILEMKSQLLNIKFYDAQDTSTNLMYIGQATTSGNPEVRSGAMEK